MNAIYPLTRHSKKDIYRVGYQLKNNLYLAEVINAGANYWKHEPEWSFCIDTGATNDDGLTEVSINRTGINLDALQKKTFNTITKITRVMDKKRLLSFPFFKTFSLSKCKKKGILFFF
jgi:hypothetical protein